MILSADQLQEAARKSLLSLLLLTAIFGLTMGTSAHVSNQHIINPEFFKIKSIATTEEATVCHCATPVFVRYSVACLFSLVNEPAGSLKG